MEKDFIRVKSAKDLTISLSMLAAGCVMVIIPAATPVSITGFFILFAGIILALILKSGYKDKETGEKYYKTEHYFSHEKMPQITEGLKSRPETIDLEGEDKGNALRLDIYFNKRNHKAFLQLFEYVPYKYEQCSDLYEYETARIEKLIK